MQPTTKPALTRTALPLTALAIAKTQIGVMEEPPGSNRGKQVDAYIRSVGLNPVGSHYPYCAAFVFWCMDQASKQLGIINPAPKTAGAVDLWNKAYKPRLPHRIPAVEARDNYGLVKPGAVFILLINANTQAGHAGFVAGVDYKTGQLVTYEANSNENGSREGLGCFRLTRRNINDRALLGFLDYTDPLLPV